MFERHTHTPHTQKKNFPGLKEYVTMAKNVQQLKENLDKYGYVDRTYECSSGLVYTYTHTHT